MTISDHELRATVAEVVREVVSELRASTPSRDSARARSMPLEPVQGASGGTTSPRMQDVRIRDDEDLRAFAVTLLKMFENPKSRQDLRAGRLAFRLVGGPDHAHPETRRVRRIDRGAVTERQIQAAADAHERVVLGPRAVLTPLGREKARAMGVDVEKER